MIPVQMRDADKDSTPFFTLGLMTAVITSMKDWRAFCQSLLSISQQVACADETGETMVSIKLGSLGVSIHFTDEQLFPDNGMELITQTILGPMSMYTVDELGAWVLRQKRVKSVFEQYRDLMDRAEARIGKKVSMERVHVLMIPQQGVWHPYRLATISAAIAQRQEWSSVCALECTVDAPGYEPPIGDEDFNGAQAVEQCVPLGQIGFMRVPMEKKDHWISMPHDLAVPFRIVEEFFQDPAHQWFIERNRYVDSHYTSWVRSYTKPGHNYQTGYINAQHWLLYWVPRGQETAELERALQGGVPVRIVKGMEGETALKEHALMIAELYEHPLWRKAAPNLRKQQVSAFGTDTEKADGYTKLCAEYCVSRMKERKAMEAQQAAAAAPLHID